MGISKPLREKYPMAIMHIQAKKKQNLQKWNNNKSGTSKV
jgi:hypothetical protein